VFCNSFLLGRGPYPPCRRAWCGPCYREMPEDPFPRLQGVGKDQSDEWEAMEVESEEDERHRSARNGDHLVTSFECDLCHFRNCCGRDPHLSSHKDRFTLVCIRRGNLDAFWSREISTVRDNLRRVQRDEEAVKKFTSVTDLVPEFGNPTVKDRLGMKFIIAQLVTTLREGKNTENIQWDTARKTGSWIRNAWDAGVNYVSQGIMGADKSKAYVSSCPTVADWFTRASHGCKARMGKVKIQNEPLTAEIVLAMDDIASREWDQANEEERADIEDVMCYVMFEFCCALRGEEVPMISLRGLIEFWDEAASDPDPFIMVTLFGRFKGEMIDTWHCIPIPDHTASNLPARKWISQKLRREVQYNGRREGPFFKKEGKKGKMSQYNGDFRTMIDKVKTHHPHVISEAAKTELFSLWRSGRRGATLATTGKVSDEIINLFNRWRKVEAGKGSGAEGLSMHQTYLHVKNTMPQLREYGKVL